MMVRRFALAVVLGGLVAAPPAFAQSLADQIARQMSKQGFRNIQIEETWLGRTRITGTRSGGSREIIVNPNTGEILRDLWLNADGQVRAADIDFDDDGDVDVSSASDDSADDGGSNSGSGSSGSGSGGTGSGGSDDDSDSGSDGDSDDSGSDNSGRGSRGSGGGSNDD